MILAFLLSCLIPVTIGADPDGKTEMAYLWDGKGVIVTASGGLWATTTGDGYFSLPQGRRIKRVWRFAAVDAGSCFEGDVNITRNGVAVFLSAPHKEAERGIYDAWTSTPVDVLTDGPSPFHVRWVCRVTCGRTARCHYGLQLELAPS